METNFNFKSQICTSIVQSERLLSLGLKKETADMWYPHFAPSFPIPLTEDDYVHELNNDGDVPAWSLHRLCDMMPKCIAIDGDSAYPLQITKRYDGQWVVGYQGWYDCVGDLYNNIIFMYQLLISEGYIDEEFCNKG